MFTVDVKQQCNNNNNSQREGERGEKGQRRVKMSKQPPPPPPPPPTPTYCKRNRPSPYYHPNCRTPRHWKFTQDLRTTRPPPWIGNRELSVMLYSAVLPLWYSVLFYSNTCSTNQMQLEVIACKTEIRKGKKTKVACGDNTQSWNQAETMSLKGKCVYNPK